MIFTLRMDQRPLSTSSSLLVLSHVYRLTYTDNTIGATRKPEQEAGFIVFRLPLVRAAIIITHAPSGDES